MWIGLKTLRKGCYSTLRVNKQGWNPTQQRLYLHIMKVK
jgi:hypothetical protein